VLEDIRVWARTKENVTPVYCIADVAGTGKSTISHTMHDEWSSQPTTPLAFFFSLEGAGTQTATDFCFFIKEQIEALGLPELHDYWKGLAPSLTILRSQKVEQQWARLVLEPLRLLPKSETRVLVVDALDECTMATREPLLECILKACSSESLSHMRIFITTRNEPDIVKLLQNSVYKKSVLQKSLRNSPSAKADVALYVNHRLDETNIFTSAPEQRQILTDRCDGLFIFAFLACKLLEDACGDSQPLEDILHEFTSLDVLFYRTLSRADVTPKYTRELLKNILGTIVVAQEPLSVSAITDLLPTPAKQTARAKPTDVANMVGRLGSILGSGGIDEPVYILHATFTDFLLRQTWVTTSGERARNDYAINKAQCNRVMARGCLSILLNELQGVFPELIEQDSMLTATRKPYGKGNVRTSICRFGMDLPPYAGSTYRGPSYPNAKVLPRETLELAPIGWYHQQDTEIYA
jgi:NACHT domain